MNMAKIEKKGKTDRKFIALNGAARIQQFEALRGDMSYQDFIDALLRAYNPRMRIVQAVNAIMAPLAGALPDLADDIIPLAQSVIIQSALSPEKRERVKAALEALDVELAKMETEVDV